MTAPFDLFADDPAPTPAETDLFDEALFDGPESQADSSAHAHQEPLEAQPQLAPRHAGNQAGAPLGAMPPENPADAVNETIIANGTLAGSEVGAAMHLSGHDIRMREFRRALLRGYSRNDVDGFLTDVIESFDACERTLMNANNAVHETPQRPTATAPEQSVMILKHAQEAAAEVIEQAQHSAQALHGKAQADADQIVRSANQQAQAVHEATLQAARADAERGLLRARDRARDILQQAADREQQAARIEAEAELRLAHIEQRLAEKAKGVADQADHLNSLAAWLAEQDLRPEDPSAHGAPVAHAATSPAPEGDVLAFRQ